MTFAETYREERLINRRSRARKARILGRIIGFGLTICLMVALRTDPQLRSMVNDLALAAMGKVAATQADSPADVQADAINALGYRQGSEEARVIEGLGISGEARQVAPSASRMPQSRIKVNRPGSG